MSNQRFSPWKLILAGFAMFAFVLTLSSLPAFGQATAATGAIQGTVTDQSDAVVPGATVTIKNVATGQTVTRTTTGSGIYNSGPLNPGNYTVSVTAKGFSATNLPTTVTVGNISPGNVKLGLAAEKQEVTVEANGVTVNTEQATVQGVITSEQIENLPINGRNFLDAAQLEPGVQIQDGNNFDPTKNGFAGISIGGRAGRTTRIEVDGLDVTDETVGTTTQNIPADSIQEFQLSQSTLDMSTELTSSGAVNVLTKSGTNTVHGEGFYLFRDKRAGDANFPGGADVPFQRNHTGFTLGGPILKDRLFFFASGENITQHLFQPVVAQGPFAPLSGGYGAPFKEKQISGRLDYTIKGSAKLFYKFAYDDNILASSETNFQPFFNQDNTPSHAIGLDFNTGSFTHSIRFGFLKFHNLIGDAAQASGAFDPIPNAFIEIRGISPRFQTGPNDLAPQQTFQTDHQIKYDGSKIWGDHIVRYGVSFNAIRGGGLASFFGLAPEIRSTISATPNGAFAGGAANPLNYPVTGIFLGNGQGFFTEQPGFGFPAGGQSDDRFSFYVGDSWKLRPNLTLNYALRYVRDTGRTDSDLAAIPCSAIDLANFDPAPPCTGNLLDNFGNIPGLGNPVKQPNGNLAPQVGITWDPFHNGKTVIRAGAGLFYENAVFNNVLFDRPVRLTKGLFNSVIGNLCPNGVAAFPGGNAVTSIDGLDIASQICGQPIGSVAQNIVDLQNSFQAATKAAGVGVNPNFVGESLDANLGGQLYAPDYKSPRSYQMNVGVQREFGKGTVVSADYLRNVSTHFLLGVNTNHTGDARFLNKTAAQNAIAATLANCGVATIDAGLAPGACATSPTSGKPLKTPRSLTIDDFANNGLDSLDSFTGGVPIEALGPAFGVPLDPSLGAAFPGINPFFGDNSMLFPIGRSVYNALEISVRQRLVSNPLGMLPFIHGVNAQFAYTLSRFDSMAGDQDFINNANDFNNPTAFFGPTSFDRRHQFSFGTIFTFPASVQMSFIGHFNSPLPTTLVSEDLGRPGEIFHTDFTGDGTTGDIIPGQNIGTYGRSVSAAGLASVIANYNVNQAGTLTPAGQALVNAGLFTQTQLIQLGAVKDTLAPVQPGTLYANDWLRAFDMRFSVPIKVKERVSIEPSISIFNIFNFANFAISPATRVNGVLSASNLNGTVYTGAGNPNATNTLDGSRAGLGSGTFSLGAPRQLEYGLKITF
ncbi:MAG TPA: carboxypeptidase regulatory-like domain-containing protein [Terriglobales bacterium]|nr:carboxypeptidase regulatory-like domain-containing protein [Terriglobales bacterium]